MVGLARELRMLEAMHRKNLRELHYGTPKQLFVGQTDAASSIPGCAVMYINFTSVQGASASGDLAATIALVPTGLGAVPASAFTQSHAAGQIMDGSVTPTLVCESPADWTGAQAQFVLDLMHILRGQLGANVDFRATAIGTLPALKGVNGASSDANVPAAGMNLQVFGRGFAGGI